MLNAMREIIMPHTHDIEAGNSIGSLFPVRINPDQ